jgi:hypothetical protein
VLQKQIFSIDHAGKSFQIVFSKTCKKSKLSDQENSPSVTLLYGDQEL